MTHPSSTIQIESGISTNYESTDFTELAKTLTRAQVDRIRSQSVHPALAIRDVADAALQHKGWDPAMAHLEATRIMNNEVAAATAGVVNGGEIEDRIQAAFAAVRDLPGLRIRRSGDWLWAEGDTKPHREAFKAAGWRWAPKRAEWYFAGRPSGGGRGGMGREYIKGKYGEQDLN